MQFEHIVAVNDLNNPFTLIIRRHQLWHGLMLRIRSPELFIPGVDEVRIEEIAPTLLLREMQLGKMRVTDKIYLVHEQQIRFETEAGLQHSGGMLEITIQEPEPNDLMVRFRYERPSCGDPEEEALSDYLYKMWQQVDLDGVRLIRSLVEQEKIA